MVTPHQRTQQLFNVGSTVSYIYDPIGQLKVADSATATHLAALEWQMQNLTSRKWRGRQRRVGTASSPRLMGSRFRKVGRGY